MNTLARVEYPEFKNRATPVEHGFFGRNGGVSDGFYQSLNVSYSSSDGLENIKENRRRIAAVMDRAHLDIQTVNQVHGNSCLVYEDIYDSESEAPDADALVTDRRNVPLAVMTADCAPILLYGQKSNGRPVIGAAHAGWCGALKGIIESTVKAMVHLDTDMTSIVACIGPCIQRKNYEVTYDFSHPFLEEDPLSERFFSAGKADDKLQFDLPGYVAYRLARSGVKNVLDIGLDTYTAKADFFSCRRAQHATENDYGRQASVIMIK